MVGRHALDPIFEVASCGDQSSWDIHACKALHGLVGLLLFAKPRSFSIVPKRQGDTWVLGSVGFANLNIWNAAPVAFAPVLMLGIGYRVAAVSVFDVAVIPDIQLLDLAGIRLRGGLFLVFLHAISD
jgi:hypothetical protein